MKKVRLLESTYIGRQEFAAGEELLLGAPLAEVLINSGKAQLVDDKPKPAVLSRKVKQ